jgi:hypothetical protein
MKSNAETDIRAVVRDGITRTIGAVGLAGIALIHTIDAPSHFVGGSDTWLGVAYLGLIASALVLAGALVFRGDRRTWLAATGLVTATMIGFTLSRTVGLPGDSGDIGNWGEAIGIASMFVEGSFLMLAAGVLVGGVAPARDAQPVPVYAAPIPGIRRVSRAA